MATVLIIEDETPILVLADSILESAGHQTVTAPTLAEAEAVISSDAEFDIVFTDVNLGEHHEGGVQIGRLAQKKRPGVPILYTSGRNLTDGLNELLVEPSSFLSKTYTDKDLLDAIGQLSVDKSFAGALDQARYRTTRFRFDGSRNLSASLCDSGSTSGVACSRCTSV